MPGNSAVSICSNALLLLGDRPISSFSENNDRTRLVANIYDYTYVMGDLKIGKETTITVQRVTQQ